MSGTSLVHPGTVAWTGDNSSIYLSSAPDARYRTLASSFRVARSPHGAGRVLVLIVDRPVPRALCLYDHELLARWLVADFARHFPQLRGREEVQHLDYLALHAHEQEMREGRHVERFAAGAHEVELCWERLGESFLVTLAPEHSATGRHEMISVFVDAHRAGGRLDGVELPGRVQPRRHFGRATTTAFLALSETWIEPAPAPRTDRSGV